MDATGAVQIITALGTLATTIGGVIITVKLSGVEKKVDSAHSDAKTFASDRANQVADLKETVLKGNAP